MDKDSIFYRAIRSLASGMFYIIGLCLGIIPAIMILAFVISGSTSSTTSTVEQTTTVKVLPDASNKRTASTTTPVLLQVNIDGILGLDSYTTDKIRTQLVESREGNLKDDRVKGILLHIDSPGGTVSDGDGIYRLIKEYKKLYNVPVVAYSEGLCASGGYYVACAADEIYACNTCLVGSVGVIMPSFMNFSKLMENVGISAITLYSGKNKDDMDPTRPWKEGEEANYRYLCDYYYDYFVNIVTSNRSKVDKEKLISEYGAKIFPAGIAKDYGYIDGTLENRNEAVAILAEKAGIKEEYQVVTLDSGSILSQLLKMESSPVLTGKIEHEIKLTPEYDAALMGKFLYLYRPE